jgi:crossover junction endodeoxyribonuclease RuvC
VALVSSDGRLRLFDTPTATRKTSTRVVTEVDPAQLAQALRDLGELPVAAAYVEQVGAMPGQGVSSMFAFGRALGIVEGALAVCGHAIVKVPPQTWQRAMKVRGKDGSRERAAQEFPQHADLFKRKKDDGRSDAALIALYGLRQLQSL